MRSAILPRVDADTSVNAGNMRFGRVFERGLPLGRIGSLEVRLARGSDEIAAAQEVRYRVFHEELGARSTAAAALDRRDADRFETALHLRDAARAQLLADAGEPDLGETLVYSDLRAAAGNGEAR